MIIRASSMPRWMGSAEVVSFEEFYDQSVGRWPARRA
jgi:hypothetical protein